MCLRIPNGNVSLTEKARAQATRQVEFIIQLQAPYADEEYLRQAIRNLIGNTINYSRESVTIKISSEYTDTQTLIHIKDNGLGIPPKDRLRILRRSNRDTSNSVIRRKRLPDSGWGITMYNGSHRLPAAS
ncbi:MAG: ATP-binding protein [Bacteroides sp.]|nr:ATP-binding protein [Bacteroides sp.]